MRSSPTGRSVPPHLNNRVLSLTATTEAACTLSGLLWSTFRQTETRITFSVDTQYGAPVITACQCVTPAVWSIFRKPHKGHHGDSVSEQGPVTEERCPGLASQKSPPPRISSPHPGSWRYASRCNVTPS